MNLNQFGFNDMSSTESYEEEIYDEGTEGIRKLWNRHFMGSMKLNTHERDELIKKLEEYSSQARSYIKNELTTIIKTPEYDGKVVVKYPTGKSANIKDVSYQSTDGQAVFRVGVLVELDGNDAIAMRKLNKVINKLTDKFIKEHKPPIALSHELRIGRIHCIVPDRAILEHPMKFGKETEEYDVDIFGNESFLNKGFVGKLRSGGAALMSGIKGAHNAYTNLFIKLDHITTRAMQRAISGRDMTEDDAKFMLKDIVKITKDAVSTIDQAVDGTDWYITQIANDKLAKKSYKDFIEGETYILELFRIGFKLSSKVSDTMGDVPGYVNTILDVLKSIRDQLPDNFYLNHEDTELVSIINSSQMTIVLKSRSLKPKQEFAGKESEYDFNYTKYAYNLEEGTESIRSMISNGFKSLKSFFNKGCQLFSNAFWDLLFWSNDLSSEDYEFMKSKEMKKIGDQIVKEYKSKNILFDILPITPKNIKPEYFDTDKFDFGSYKYEDFLRLFTTEDDMRAFHYPLCILKLNDRYTLNTIPSEETKKSEEVWTEINKFMEERSPKKFTLVPIPVSDTEMILIYCSPRYKNKNKVITPAGESYNLFEFSNRLEDYNLFKQNPYGFGLETQTIDYNHVLQDCKDMYDGNESSSLIPIDMDMDTYMIYMGGTEGIADSVGGAFARGWAKFRRILHPVIKSDIKLSQEEFNELKAKFQTQIQKAMPGFESKLKENRLIAFLIENDAIIINKNVKDAFDNDSRLVSAILVTINSSKIKMGGDSYIVVNGKKKDIMDLRNEDKFFNGADSEGVVYIAINDIISAINKTVYAEIKKESSLNKLGLSAALLNDGVQHKIKRSGRSVQYDWNNGGVSTRDNYEVEHKNTILEQLQNKNLLIGLRSRPVVITTQNIPQTATESENIFMQGGIEMGVRNFSNQISEIDNQVERLKDNVMYKGVESEIPQHIDNTDPTTKEILHRVLDEYGPEGLKRILK